MAHGKLIRQMMAPGVSPRVGRQHIERMVEAAPRSIEVQRDIAVILSPFAMLDDPEIVRGFKIDTSIGAIILRQLGRSVRVEMVRHDSISKLHIHMASEVITVATGRIEAASWMSEMAKTPHGSMISRLFCGHDAGRPISGLTLTRQSC